MGAVALALAASVSWGCADFVGGLKARALPLLVVMLVSQGAGLAIMAVIVLVRGKGPPDAEFALYAALAAIGGLVGLAALYRGLAVGAMAVVSPITGLGAAVPVAFGVLTGDRPGVAQSVGIVLALAGVALASREESPGEGGTRAAAGIGLALISALGIGWFLVAMKKASEGDALWAILANRITGVSMIAVVCLVARPRFALARPDVAALVSIGALDMTANTMFALATREGLVSVVAVLSSLYPVVVVGLAFAFLRERMRSWQAFGVALALAGVAAIAAG